MFNLLRELFIQYCANEHDEYDFVNNPWSPERGRDGDGDTLALKVQDFLKGFTGDALPIKSPTLTITVEGGTVQDVTGLPEGWDYEIDDKDV